MEAPGPNRRWRITSLSASVSAGSALLTVTTDDGSGVAQPVLKWQESVAAGGPVSPNLADGIQCDPNASVTIALSDAGVGNVGSINGLVAAE